MCCHTCLKDAPLDTQSTPPRNCKKIKQTLYNLHFYVLFDNSQFIKATPQQDYASCFKEKKVKDKIKI